MESYGKWQPETNVNQKQKSTKNKRQPKTNVNQKQILLRSNLLTLSYQNKDIYQKIPKLFGTQAYQH